MGKKIINRKPNVKVVRSTRNKRTTGGDIPLELRPQYRAMVKKNFRDPYEGVSLKKLSGLVKQSGLHTIFPIPFIELLIQLINAMKHEKKQLGIEDYRIIFQELLAKFPTIKLNVTEVFITNFIKELERTKNLKIGGAKKSSKSIDVNEPRSFQTEVSWYDNALNYAASKQSEFNANINTFIKDIDTKKPISPEIIKEIASQLPKLPTIPVIPSTPLPPLPSIPQQIIIQRGETKEEKKKRQKKNDKKRDEAIRSQQWMKSLGKEKDYWERDVKTANKLKGDWRDFWDQEEDKRRRYEDNQEEGELYEEPRLGITDWFKEKYDEYTKPLEFLEELEIPKKGIVQQVKDKWNEYQEEQELLNTMYEEGNNPPKQNIDYLKDLGRNLMNLIDSKSEKDKEIEMVDFELNRRGIGVGIDSDDDDSSSMYFSKKINDNDEYDEHEFYDIDEDIPIYQSTTSTTSTNMSPRDEKKIIKEEKNMMLDIGKDLIKDIFTTQKDRKIADDDFKNFVDDSISKWEMQNDIERKGKEMRDKKIQDDIIFNEIFAEIDPEIIKDEIQQQQPYKTQTDINNDTIDIMSKIAQEEYDNFGKEFGLKKQKKIYAEKATEKELKQHGFELEEEQAAERRRADYERAQKFKKGKK